MKNQLILSCLFFLAITFNAQAQIDSLVKLGINYHDTGQYDKAIEVYKIALEQEPNSSLIHYEMALTYMYAHNYEEALKHSEKVIKNNDKFLKDAYLTKGSCLDYLGKTKESIKLFKKGLKKFGDDYLLYYNLGYNYYRLGEYDDAEEALINAINTNPNHGSSHLMLGSIMREKNKKVQGLLCFYYFLFLEPDTDRSKMAFGFIEELYGDNVEKNPDEPNSINIFLDVDNAESEFGTVELMISLLAAGKYSEENEGKSQEELFIENTDSFFSMLGELKKKKNEGLWWELYVPIFYDITQTEHLDTFCYYILQSSSENTVDWLKSNEEKLEAFASWLEGK